MQTMIFIALVTAGLCFTGLVTYGQTFSEWWQQKRTRIKYLHKQIAALEEFRSVLREGYQEAEAGVDSVEVITEEELSMHKQFLGSLQLVKPSLKDHPGLMASYALVAVLVEKVNEKLDSYINDLAFTEEELQWLGAYLGEMIRDIREELRELEALTTDDVLTMRDEERYDEIRVTEQHIRSRYEDGVLFLQQMDELLGMARQQKVNEEYLKKLL
ncbi:MAG TPA: hypothetical protein VHD83_13430 [Puia sp.]|nr:hypothetical protein [Puia sp.]